MDPQIRLKCRKIGFGRGSGFGPDFGCLPGAPLDRPMWLPYSKYHIQLTSGRSPKSAILEPFRPPFWSPFGLLLRILRFQKVSKKMLKNRTPKIPKMVSKWLPKGLALLAEIGFLGGPVEHWGPEVPHKGEKGSKITKKCPKRPNTYPRYTNKNIKNNKSSAHLPLQRPLGPGAAVSCRRLLNMDLDISSLGFDRISGHKMGDGQGPPWGSKFDGKTQHVQVLA